MTKGLRFGLLGCGMMGREHIHNLHLTGAEVAVIAEPDEAMKSKAREDNTELSITALDMVRTSVRLK